MHSQHNAIDRKALVRRHCVEQRSLYPRSPVSVGNGEFCFTMDLTGLQTLPAAYPVGARNELPAGTLLGTQSQWGWHSIPAAEDYNLAGSTVLYDSPRGQVPYVDMVGNIVDGRENQTTGAETWLRANPHRLDLGRIGFALSDDEAAGPAGPLTEADVVDPVQILDLWTGTVTSTFTLRGYPVSVSTACHPDRDQLGIRVESSALLHGLTISLTFPYGSDAWHNAADWNRPDAHRTTLENPAPAGAGNRQHWTVHRDLDGSGYQVKVAGEGLRLDQVGKHELLLRPAPGQDTLDVAIDFICTGQGDCFVPGVSSPARQAALAAASGAAASGTAVIEASRAHWPQFWSSGGAIDLHGTADPRAAELERRIVLSQYLTAINCAGSLPPQETGLVCNSWRGRFHLEMHWWHAAHFAQWNRTELLLPSLRWYGTILESARQTAKAQGFDGVRWPKQVGPDGRESPSPIGTFLIWQQPHPIHLAELAYRAVPSQELLEEFSGIVFETAEFMAGFAHPTERGFELGPPLIPAQESYGSIRGTVSNPTFELAYWQWALRTAATWGERLGLEPREKWLAVADGMVHPRTVNGVYAAIDVAPFTIRADHPSMLCALGMLPQTDLIDPETMRATLADVLGDWDWESTWGWDYPVMAMTAARLDDPETAVNALLQETGKNTALPNGHNRQTDSLPVYLPGNGGLLAAAALMAAGWDHGPDRHAPGFPADWTVAWEGLVAAP